jgi:hypothetical protein
LIELVVVLALMVLLIALLMPGLGRLRYNALSTKCMAEKREIMEGLILYAGEHRGAYPWRAGGRGQIMNPKDKNCFILQELHENYGVPYGMWICPVHEPSLKKRNETSLLAVERGIARGTWKWIAEGAITYWVEQGGARGGACRTAVPIGDAWRNSIYPREVVLQKPLYVILADKLNATIDGEPFDRQAHHTYRGRAVHSIVAGADGHVERRPRSAVKRRFYSGYTHAY